MVAIANWFLSFTVSFVNTVLGFVSADGYSFGYMVIGIVIVGMVVSATVGAVAIASNSSFRFTDRDGDKHFFKR